MSDLVKVKILSSVGQWMAGDEVEVTPEQAKAMCTPRKKNNGYELVEHRHAITMDELQKIKDLPRDKSLLTVDDLKELGLKNVVETPKEEIEKPFHPGFKDTKDSAEGASALQTLNSNEKNPNKKQGSKHV